MHILYYVTMTYSFALVIPRMSTRTVLVKAKVRDGYLQKMMSLRFRRYAFRILHHNDVEYNYYTPL